MIRSAQLAMVVLSSALTACQSIIPVQPGNPSYAPTFPPVVIPGKEVRRGTIYNRQTAMSLFETPRARNIGDILTISLLERTEAQKRAQTLERKDGTDTLTNPTLFGRPVSLGGGSNLGFDINTKRQFNGQGESKQNNRLTGSISVTVAEVLANGNLRVQGEKWIQINQGQEYVRLSGIVRPQDITPDNTVTSDRVANARIAYSGTGQVANANVQGWFSKFLWSAFYPF